MNEDELVFIFRRASDYLDSYDSLKLLCLNHYFHQHLPSLEFYFYVSKSIVSWISNLDRNDPEILNHFAKFLECSPFTSYEDLYNCIKSSQNIIKNPCGENGFDFWEICKGDNGLLIEDYHYYRNKKTLFSCAFRKWCSLTQTISIPSSDTNQFLIIGSHVTRRDLKRLGDLGAVAKLEAIIFDENHEIVEKYHTAKLHIYKPIFYQLKLKFEIHPNYREVIITFYGKDRTYWRGHYGAGFGYLYARLFNNV